MTCRERPGRRTRGPRPRGHLCGRPDFRPQRRSHPALAEYSVSVITLNAVPEQLPLRCQHASEVRATAREPATTGIERRRRGPPLSRHRGHRQRHHRCAHGPRRPGRHLGRRRNPARSPRTRFHRLTTAARRRESASLAERPLPGDAEAPTIGTNRIRRPKRRRINAKEAFPRSARTTPRRHR